MHQVVWCLSLILFLFWFNGARGHTVPQHKVDSVFQTLNKEQKLRRLLWVEVTDINQLEDLSRSRNIYVNSGFPISHDVTRDYNVYFQLDHSMSLGLGLDMPSLRFLAALENHDLLDKYFVFLKNLGKANGISAFVLPSSSNYREAVFIEKLESFDPNYFLKYEALSFDWDDKKRHMRDVFSVDNFLVVNHKQSREAFETFGKWQKKIRVNDINSAVKKVIKVSLEEFAGSDAQSFPESLRLNILESAVAGLETREVFPLVTDTLCFLTNEPYGKMANMLRHYTYVITSWSEIMSSNAPVLADHSPLFAGGLEGRSMIYVGTVDKFDQSLFDAALIVPDVSDEYHYILPQQLFGAKGVSGKITDRYSLLDHFEEAEIRSSQVLGYAPYDLAGLSEEDIDSISTIIEDGIAQKAFPGCQLAIAYRGAVILDRSFGYLTYDNIIPVYQSTLYDLASVTKVAGTLLAIMKLYDQKKIDLDGKLGHYLPRYEESNKKEVTIRSLLSHQAGLLPYVPFWKRALTKDYLEPFYYESAYDELLDNRSFGLKPSIALKDTLSSWILNSPLLEYDSIPYYSYSDIGFMVLQEVVESITEQSLSSYLQEQFYDPLGLQKTTFNPKRAGFDLYEIAPTEYDNYYRSEQVWGDVHDRNAAILDGVAGHAGLFSNTSDLLVISQMLLQGGNYRQQRYFDSQTINVFNSRYFQDNRRGLGWDKLDREIENVSGSASDESYGHTGFTGTMVWVDPKYELAFVFLSNRVHPNVNNRKLNELDIRTRIQDVVYKAIQAKFSE